MASKQPKEPLQPNGERHDYTSLCLSENETLEEVMRLGVQPEIRNLVGWEFRGYNTLDLTSLAGIRKFKKGFYQEDPSTDPEQGCAGYNVQVIQTPLGDDWFEKIRDGQSIKHGWYNCYPVRLTEVDCKYPNGVLINYDCQKNPRLDPSRKLRDYLVQVYADNKDLYLGKAYGALAGPIRLFFSYFVLERANPSALQSPA
jgi:hypothetical protein